MLTELPVIVVDSLLGKYVSDNDLRAIHQVSSGWKNLIETRPLINAKRLALVNTIKEHKENIRSSNQSLVLPAKATESKGNEEDNASKDTQTHDEKNGPGSGRTLRSLNNHLLVTPASSVEESTSSGRRLTRISSTPKSRFQRRYEAGLKLMPGQVLFSCPGCNSPVASPLPAPQDKKQKADADTDSLECEDSDSGICLSMTSSLEDFPGSNLIKQDDYFSTIFQFNSPEISSTSAIDISMIITPPCTPPTLETGQDEYNGSIDGPMRDFQTARSPSCPFLSSTSALTISECDSLPSDVNNASSLICKEIEHVTNINITEPEMHREDSADLCLSTREKLKTRDTSSLLHSLHKKQLKLKSCSSPSLLVSEVKDDSSKLPNTFASSQPAVVQCPDCSYRFCSKCQFSEHLGKPCKLLGGDEMYEEDEDLYCHSLPPPTTRPTSKPRTRSANSSVGKTNKKKSSLRRLAYL